MLVKSINSNTIDVFTGNGWSQWSRFQMNVQKGRVGLRLVAGSPMKQDEFKQLLSQVKG